MISERKKQQLLYCPFHNKRYTCLTKDSGEMLDEYEKYSPSLQIHYGCGCDIYITDEVLMNKFNFALATDKYTDRYVDTETDSDA